MAGGIGQRVRKDLLTYFGGGSITQPAAWYVSLHTADPGDRAQNSNEASGGSYARVQVNAIGGSNPNWAAVPTPGAAGDACVLSNEDTITFPTSSGAWSSGTSLTWFGLWTHVSTATEAVFLGRGQLSVSQSVAGSGVTLSFAAGQLQMTMDDT